MTTSETPARRPSSNRWLVVSMAIAVVIVLAIAVSFPLRWLYRQQVAAQKKAGVQQALVQEVEQLGGKLSYAIATSQQPFQIAAVDSVDLANTAAGGGLLERLCQLTTIQRLNLDGTKIQEGDLQHVARLSGLESLSLAQTEIGGSDLGAIAKLPSLKKLSLHGTGINDADFAPISGMTNLVILDISQTGITADGMKALQKLPSLRTLTLEDRCLTPESVVYLQSIKSLEMVEVCVANGLGREARELLSGNLAANVLASNANGVELWTASAPWDETLAGIVESVVAELSLDAQERDRLVAAMDGHGLSRQQSQPNVGYTVRKEEEGLEITSCEQFLEILRTTDRPPKSAMLFARHKFTKRDIPKLLQALRSLDHYRDAASLHPYGSFLLAEHGQDDPEAIRELDKMLSDRDKKIREITIWGFGRSGHFYDDDWVPSEQLAEFAIPRLLRMCEDESTPLPMSVSEVLGDLATYHPKYAPRVLPALVKIMHRGEPGYQIHSLTRVSEANREAALAMVPELRRKLQKAATEMPQAYRQRFPKPGDAERAYRQNLIHVICLFAWFSPALAKEVAAEQLQDANADIDGLLRHGFLRLASRDNPEAVQIIFHEMLDRAQSDDQAKAANARSALVSVAIAIRDWRAEAKNGAPAP